MPYIADEDRQQYDHDLNGIEEIKTKGDLEYCIARLMDIYMKTRAYRYSDLHDCAYAAQHSCDEFRRRFLDSREDQAIDQNGDVYTFFPIERPI